jgi:hypothetical protein
MAGRVVPNSCVLIVGVSIKDLDEDEDQYMYYLVIPTAPPSKATQLFKDRTDVFAQIPKDQWMVSVTWLTRSDDHPLEFAVSDAPHARYIGIRDSTVRGVIGHFGADVMAAAWKYTISAEFHSRIRKRNLYASSWPYRRQKEITNQRNL